MVFNSLHFLFFFAVVYGLYRSLPHRAQNWLLLLASYYFYAAWDWRFLGLLLGSTIVDYFCALFIARHEDPRTRRRALLVSLGFNLGVLGFFKYYGFFADNLRALLAFAGWQVSIGALHVILPLGISFYTFMTMSYVIDVYRREIQPSRHLPDFALFVAYFPHLVAGPILRASALIPQIERPRQILTSQLVDGAWLIGWGLFKKMFVADNLARIVDAIFAPGHRPDGAEVLMGVYAFAFQIYGDFSGYSDIARGVSKLMGIDLNINFRYPYFVLTPQEFWRHWHISLSSWLRDYLYIPLGGNRGSAWATRRNLLVTMVLGGLWHGAAWPFVIWGFYQGLLLIVYRPLLDGAHSLKQRLTGGTAASAARPARFILRLGLWLGAWLVMFHLTCYGWLLFRARSFAQITSMSASLVGDFSWRSPALAAYAPLVLGYAGVAMAINAYEASRDDVMAVFALPRPVRYAVFGALFYLTMLFGQFGGTEFIYFQF